MRRMIVQKMIPTLLIVLFCSVGTLISAEKFPDKDINIYVGFPPGGSTSAQVVPLAEMMKKHVDVNVMCQYKPGATQTIAADFVAKSKPDGHTLVFLTMTDFIPKLIIDGHQLKFRAEDFVPLGAATYSPVILAVSAESEWKSLEDLLDHGRKVPPGTLSYASPSLYSLPHIVAEAFVLKTGIALNHIPFQGGGPAITAILGRHADMFFMSEGLIGARIKPGGGLRGLAVVGNKRLKNFPDMPTLKEKGYDLDFTIWWALFAPAGIPTDVHEKLAELYAAVVKDQDMIAWMEKTGYSREYLSPEGVQKRMQREFAVFGEILKKIK